MPSIPTSRTGPPQAGLRGLQGLQGPPGPSRRLQELLEVCRALQGPPQEAIETGLSSIPPPAVSITGLLEGYALNSHLQKIAAQGRARHKRLAGASKPVAPGSRPPRAKISKSFRPSSAPKVGPPRPQGPRSQICQDPSQGASGSRLKIWACFCEA